MSHTQSSLICLEHLEKKFELTYFPGMSPSQTEQYITQRKQEFKNAVHSEIANTPQDKKIEKIQGSIGNLEEQSKSLDENLATIDNINKLEKENSELDKQQRQIYDEEFQLEKKKLKEQQPTRNFFRRLGRGFKRLFYASRGLSFALAFAVAIGLPLLSFPTAITICLLPIWAPLSPALAPFVAIGAFLLMNAVAVITPPLVNKFFEFTQDKIEHIEYIDSQSLQVEINLDEHQQYQLNQEKKNKNIQQINQLKAKLPEGVTQEKLRLRKNVVQNWLAQAKNLLESLKKVIPIAEKNDVEHGHFPAIQFWEEGKPAPVIPSLSEKPSAYVPSPLEQANSRLNYIL